MQADISVVASSGLASASFWPTSGNIAALAKWKSVVDAAKTSNGGLASRTPKPDGPAASELSELPSRPRATSWSIAAAGTLSVAAMLATAIAAISQKTATGPNQ
jgi:hypothetical protein